MSTASMGEGLMHATILHHLIAWAFLGISEWEHDFVERSLSPCECVFCLSSAAVHK